MRQAATEPLTSLAFSPSPSMSSLIALALLLCPILASWSFRIVSHKRHWSNVRDFRAATRVDQGGQDARIEHPESVFSLQGKTVSSPFLAELIDRGVVAQATDLSKLDELLCLHESAPEAASGQVPAIYYGIDLTADFIHEGTLLQLLLLRRFLAHGLNVVIVLGGGTTPVGDPSFKTKRTKATIAATCGDRVSNNAILGSVATCPSVSKENYDGILNAVKKLLTREIVTDGGDRLCPSLSFASQMGEADIARMRSSRHNVVVVNNRDLYDSVTLTEFLNTVARNMSVGRMLSRESIKSRLVLDDGRGGFPLRKANMDLGEFMYMALQAADFVHVASKFNAVIQLGGSDQMGNIMSGVDLASSLSELSKPLLGVTTPLLQTRKGEKVSKSSAECLLAITAETPALTLWSHFRNVDDEVVHDYLRWLTQVPLATINDTLATHVNQAKVWHNSRSYNLTAAIYGDQYKEALHKHWLSGDMAETQQSTDGCDPAEYDSFVRFASCVPRVFLKAGELETGVPFGDLLDRVRTPQLTSGLFYSNRRAIREGTCRINGKVETRVDRLITNDDLLHLSSTDGRVMKYVALQFGKRQLHLAVLEPSHTAT
ncbi:tyrosyl-tRNA synthetase, putative [Babesia bigemina]|uniref:tyrosine--tRNA ligase n=1 Tax=Babesia bigemina TaxID=5866 RepID=A0A061D3A8_BABBI|nr:tyrosyl-tRNA synthetase, putative [Babesia bigemina]CDR94572.1 tyrosyl-tRNA synthetase, putative [Babesia bigemina]|eukprot:XP_012766758.1 tyrosyl-tRNA synthetase, putative [Babesia bigemina]